MLNLAIVGPGLVGGAFIDQVLDFQSKSNIPQIQIIGIINLRSMIFGAVPRDWKRSLETSGTSADLEKFINEVSNYKNVVLVDCTCSDEIARKYPQFLEQGFSIVTPNKKAFADDINLFNQIKALDGRRSGTWPIVLHESTVGAGLPLLRTLNDLVETGDSIISIEGIFSGTLSYIFNTFNESTPFSDVVYKAKQLGYTEPDPRDDLNGIDVARKVVILARLMGMQVSMDDVSVENIVPHELRSLSIPDFLSNLPRFDPEFARRAREAKGRLKYVGSISNGKLSVELKDYPISHCFCGLEGSDNIVRIVTKRFPNGLVIQGSGAGDQVTAFGIFSDVLSIARTLKP